MVEKTPAPDLGPVIQSYRIVVFSDLVAQEFEDAANVCKDENTQTALRDEADRVRRVALDYHRTNARPEINQ